MPYPAGLSPVKWTSYTYDGLGRTVSAVQPDGSTTSYAYAGNETTVTDPAGKWKKFTNDVEGNLVSVTDPDPANPATATFVTSYTYDWMRHLACVDMTRGGTPATYFTYVSNGVTCGTSYALDTGVKQTRTFIYDDAGRLTSATNPENGTVQYFYDVDNTLQYKHDAKGQDTVYTYDSLKRVTLLQRFPAGRNSYEDGCSRVTYSYDTNPYDSTGTFQYTRGRLAAVLYPVCNVPGSSGVTVTEMYSYHPAGAVSKKRLHIYKPWYDELYGWYRDAWADVDADYGYTLRGAMGSKTLGTSAANNGSPTCSSCGWHVVPVTYYSGFDGMGRPTSLTDTSPTDSVNGSGSTWVKDVQYDFAGRLTAWSRRTGVSWDWGGTYQFDTYAAETRGYDSSGRMTSETGLQFTFAAGQDNGQISQYRDTASGQTITYQYDSLKRLISASAAAGTGVAPWGQTFQYDGFGNLTAKGPAGALTAIPVNGATNRLSNAGYDLNGNMTSGSGATLTYDVGNRLVAARTTVNGSQTEYYGYTPDNKRIVQVKADGSALWTFRGASGEKLGTFTVNYDSNTGSYTYPYAPVLSPTLAFAGKKIWEGGPLTVDRLGTNRAGGARFNPYGEEVTTTANDRTKFATYTRDSFTGLDSLDQRYYASSYGRFNTPDPYMASGYALDPGSWNRYAYVKGDPINHTDRRGLADDDDCQWDPDTNSLRCPTGGIPGGGDRDKTPVDTGGGDHGGGEGIGDSYVLDGADLLATYSLQGGIKVTGVSGSRTINRTITAIEGNLDSDCIDWLTQSPFAPTGKFLYSFLEAERGQIGQATFVGYSDIVGIANQSAAGLNIFINSSSGFFHGGGTTSDGLNFNTDRFRAFSLIHEFAHQLGIPGFVPEGGDRPPSATAALEQSNNKQIFEHCNKTLGKFKN
jgi:RHS repeat-associated protein